MARKYVDRNFRHNIPKSLFQRIYNQIVYTREGKALFFTTVMMIMYAVGPFYYKHKEVGRKEFMRREDRKVSEAIASVNVTDDSSEVSLLGVENKD